ncbi:NitT/TauT family transport system permease protein [Rhodoblastus acidophilus]|uniref:NitT/TauT family transport system permease protein n=1 Tax=Rhodoblastus acidophilus TaxID=1074 RepID=A0A212RKQ3_RHOAC|nr:ABC transporter permease subunit [Rhodoblastus acidophilus]PPQ39050.1 sulfonate ABC transporter permease [Rhodoblastus acidophilus]RAI17014.1 sulfonate ABC transporter permease [Rhodoblastus acidophilus]SNB73077.1 NitT/TauT family transport system permease protein [Rhodoblastus acidophilus]
MISRFVAFSSLGRRALPNQWDFISLALVIAVFIGVAKGSAGMTAPLTAPVTADLSLDYSNLPYYALRTTLRMSAAMAASLVFTFVYATIAAKSRRAEMVLIPLLDVLQSVPILGFLSFTVTFFLGLFPGSTLGAELAAIFAIFTSQAWNMAFSFYQSLRTVPRDLEEVAVGYHFSPWQKFWQLEAPFAMPSLIWNMMMSMSGGWFFVVASEAISVGDTTIKLPGIGSYLALAIDAKRIDAVLAAVLAVILVILAYDQFLFRPIVAFAAKFRVELSAGQVQEESWVRQLFLRTRFLRALVTVPARMLDRIALMRLEPPRGRATRMRWPDHLVSRLFDAVWFVVIAALLGYSLYQVYGFVSEKLALADLRETVVLTLYTMIRVFVLIVLASLFWVPVSIYIGLRPRLAEKIQPLAQFLAAFPANVVFPIAVVLVVKFSLNPDIWLSGLIVFGTQWYIVFNVIGGAMAFPNDLREAVVNYGIKGKYWWKDVILPGVFPYYVTGALTASGGSWNAAIVAEYVKWGDDKVAAHGIGAYIAQATEAGDYSKIVLGVAVMSIFVILFNRLLWRPLFALGERKLRIN